MVLSIYNSIQLPTADVLSLKNCKITHGIAWVVSLTHARSLLVVPYPTYIQMDPASLRSIASVVQSRLFISTNNGPNL